MLFVANSDLTIRAQFNKKTIEAPFTIYALNYYSLLKNNLKNYSKRQINKLIKTKRPKKLI
jgi:hypothetical protein